MFDTANPVTLMLASILAGLCVSLLLYVVLPYLTSQAAPVTAALDDAARSIRRERGLQESGLLGLALSVTPLLRPLVRRLPLGPLKDSLAQRYAEAGWPGGLDDDEVLTISLMVGALVAIPATLVLLLVKPAFAAAGIVLFAIGPGFASSWLASRGDARSREITRTMPYTLDMLVLAMRAGAAFPIALERVCLDFADSHIGVEFKVMEGDLDRGTTMKEALTNLAQRAPVPVVQNFTDDLIQAEELGRPVAESLERLSDRVRKLRVQDALETAGRAKVLVLIPGMLVFVAVLLLLFAPFIVRYFYGGYTSI